jgi:hypothetical protein
MSILRLFITSDEISVVDRIREIELLELLEILYAASDCGQGLKRGIDIA